jgi:hypothetical protein
MSYPVHHIMFHQPSLFKEIILNNIINKYLITIHLVQIDVTMQDIKMIGEQWFQIT